MLDTRHAILAFAPALLASCGNGEAPEALAPDSAPLAAATANAEVPDGMITCAMRDFDGVSGVTTTERFLVIDGEVLRYDSNQNVAFPLCQPGQDGCRLGFVNGDIVMDWTSPSGTTSSYSVDLDTMQIEARRTQDGVERTLSFAEGTLCEASDLPEGLQRL